MAAEQIPHQDEQLVRVSSGIDLCYDSFGDPGDPALLLIMGLSGPMTWWSTQFCEQLAERRYFVIRFDNRDIGHSTKLSGRQLRRADAVSAFVRGPRGHPPYTLSDMAADAIGLLDHLAITQAHVMGASMGGMIAQTLAIEYPARVLSLISIMSTTGRRAVGWQHPRIIPFLLRGRAAERDEYVRRSLTVRRVIGSPGFASDPDEERRLAEETYDRGLSPDGVIRQMQAITAQPDRTAALGRLEVPALVVHGMSDRMVHVSGGRATAAAIPGSELILVPGMGHDLPKKVWPMLFDAIDRTTRRAAPSS